MTFSILCHIYHGVRIWSDCGEAGGPEGNRFKCCDGRLVCQVGGRWVWGSGPEVQGAWNGVWELFEESEAGLGWLARCAQAGRESTCEGKVAFLGVNTHTEYSQLCNDGDRQSLWSFAKRESGYCSSIGPCIQTWTWGKQEDQEEAWRTQRFLLSQSSRC